MRGRVPDPIERERVRNEFNEQRAREKRAATRARLFAEGLLRAERARPAWYADAACKGRTEVMFEIPAQVGPALALCASCPVREPCREQGYADREFGVWGGSTEVDRSRDGRGNNLMSGLAAKAQTERRRRTG